MKLSSKITILSSIYFIFILSSSCSEKIINFNDHNLKFVNREIIKYSDQANNTIHLNYKVGPGLVIIESEEFDEGVLELEIKGEDKKGKSFIGIAFNIQNDSTYEAIYFRPFNFNSKKLLTRQHSIQYISHPKHTWKSLRTNYVGQYESNYLNPPVPNQWFGIKIKINGDKVFVYDKKSNNELLNINRLEKQVSKKFGLWVGNNSKGSFKNLKVFN